MQIAKNAREERAANEVRYYGSYDPYKRDVVRLDSCGGWIGTPSDLTAFFVRIDGFKDSDQLLSDDTLRVMTTPSAVNSRYAKGLFVDSRRNNWWHSGLLDGTTTVSVRTSGDFCWSAFTNTGSGDKDVTSPLGHLVWEMVRSVADWHPEQSA
jgi:hypothetical protein